MVEQIQSKKIVLQHNDLWFDVKMHCAESHKPFELFANENQKLRNEANQMQCLREVRLKIPRRNPLSTELNDAST